MLFADTPLPSITCDGADLLRAPCREITLVRSHVVRLDARNLKSRASKSKRDTRVLPALDPVPARARGPHGRGLPREPLSFRLPGRAAAAATERARPLRRLDLLRHLRLPHGDARPPDRSLRLHGAPAGAHLSD